MRWLLTLALLIGAAWGQAGTTLVTGQVKDINNSLYVNCIWSVTFVGENAATGTGPYFPDRYVQGQQGTCDSNANLTVTLGDNVNTITPTPSQWQFNICSTTGYVPGNQFCFQFLQTITGTAQSLTSVMQQIAPVLPQSPQAITRLNNNWTGSNVFQLGLQAGPPALFDLVFSEDPSGTCSYVFAILSAGQIQLCNDGSGALQLNNGDGSGNLAVTKTIASGTAAMTTGAISSGTCGTVVTVAAFNIQTSDVVAWSYAGPVAANPGTLILNAWPTTNGANFEYCNATAGSITPPATTINWRVTR